MEAPLAVQIVSFDWPWPPIYGGIVDVYYRVDSLLKAGVQVDLHVVSHNERPPALPPDWEDAPLRVFEYGRLGWRSALSSKPYIVASREVQRLLPTLASGPRVILFEGVHTTAYLGNSRLGHQVQWVRVHNREGDYYAQLAHTDASAKQKLYYRLEARRLRSYEPRVLAEADLLLPASAQDESWCETLAPGRVLPQRSYTSLSTVESKLGRGTYVLFHAAMHVSDNAVAAVTLARRMQHRPDVKLVIAGRSPSEALSRDLAQFANVQLIASPSVEAMDDLVANAHVLALHAEHRAGYKVKVVESLARGRFVLANEDMVHGAPGLREGVTVADDEATWLDALDAVLAKPFTEQDLEARKVMLQGYLRPQLVETFKKRLHEATFTTN